MKILVNVARTEDVLHGEWMELGTGGLKLVERSDGAFDFVCTTDLATTRRYEQINGIPPLWR